MQNPRCDARRKAASTPPTLGTMNPYGGEGPPRARATQVKQWWASFREFEAWVTAHGFPSQRARGEEKKLATWWKKRREQSGKAR